MGTKDICMKRYPALVELNMEKEKGVYCHAEAGVIYSGEVGTGVEMT